MSSCSHLDQLSNHIILPYELGHENQLFHSVNGNIYILLQVFQSSTCLGGTRDRYYVNRNVGNIHVQILSFKKLLIRVFEENPDKMRYKTLPKHLTTNSKETSEKGATFNWVISSYRYLYAWLQIWENHFVAFHSQSFSFLVVWFLLMYWIGSQYIPSINLLWNQITVSCQFSIQHDMCVGNKKTLYLW